ncbi:MAG: ornithine cyclodeaminase family protein [Deltaproteobacteria bacterium]|nr:ornithine cyclodeaminase family protein [Deltaproteobacteria bacterium]
MGEDRPLYLSNDVVKQLLDMRTAIRLAEEILLAMARGQVVWAEPKQFMLHVPGTHTKFKLKGCAFLDRRVAGFRVTGLNRTDAGVQVARERPTKYVLLSDPESGAFRAIIEEEWSYAARTAAAVGVAARYLARPESRVVGILGAGYMARVCLQALHEVLRLEEARVVSARRETRERFAREMGAELGLRVLPCDDPHDVVKGADVLVTASTAATPLVFEPWLEPGIFIYSLGEYQEIETKAYRACTKLIVDDWELCQLKVDIATMVREGTLNEADVYAHLHEIVAGQKPGRETREERIFVRSQGLTTQDVGFAHWLYEQARARGLGTPL